MTRDLDSLRETLWAQFEQAVERHPKYEDSNYSSSSTPFNPAIQNRIAMAAIARSIVALETEIRERDDGRLPALRKEGGKGGPAL